MIEEVKEIFNENFKEKILNIEKIDGGWLTEKYRILTKNYDIMTKTIELKKIERRKIDIEKASRILYQCNKEGFHGCLIHFHVEHQRKEQCSQHTHDSTPFGGKHNEQDR